MTKRHVNFIPYQSCGSGFNESGSGNGSGSSISSESGSNPDPGFWWPKIEEKNTAEKFYLFLLKNCNLLIPWPLQRASKLQEKPSAPKHPVLQKTKSIYFFLFLLVTFALLDPDPDTEPVTPLNPSPIRIRIHSTALYTTTIPKGFCHQCCCFITAVHCSTMEGRGQSIHFRVLKFNTGCVQRHWTLFPLLPEAGTIEKKKKRWNKIESTYTCRTQPQSLLQAPTVHDRVPHRPDQTRPCDCTSKYMLTVCCGERGVLPLGCVGYHRHQDFYTLHVVTD